METKILLVDDEELIRDLIVSFLESENYLIEEAESSGEALAKLSCFLPDLILLDVNLHDITDGIKFSRKLREYEKTKDVPIIFITGDASQIVDSFNNGEADFIAKPFSRNEIISKIENTLKIRRTEQALLAFNRFLEEEVEIKNPQVSELLEVI
jgi:DNA-binding response OmpR family regulator